MRWQVGMGEGSWYEHVEPDVPLSQGDLVFGCPLLVWAPDRIDGFDAHSLGKAVDLELADVVVMTQACDLENDKVAEVILCRHAPLDAMKRAWEAAVRASNNNPTPKAWKKRCERIRRGYEWSQAMLDATPTIDGVESAIRVVQFSGVFTLPRGFLDTALVDGALPRLRLRSPYREHLSQAFARFFMRVGLPTGVTPRW